VADHVEAAAVARFHLGEVRPHRSELIVGLVGPEGETDASEEIAGVVPGRAERSGGAVGDEATPASARPDRPLLAPDGSRLVRRAVRGGAARNRGVAVHGGAAAAARASDA